MFRRSGSLAFVVILLLVLPGCHTGRTPYAADWNTVKVSLTTTSAQVHRSEREFKSDCQRIDYRDFKKDLDAHKGEDIYLKGTVINIDQSTNIVPDKGFTMLTLGLGPIIEASAYDSRRGGALAGAIT